MCFALRWHCLEETLTFIWIVSRRCFQKSNTGSKWHVSLGLWLTEIVGIASLLVSLSFLVLHFLLVHGPSFQLLGAALLCRPKPLQTGHLVQLLQLLDELQVVGHGAQRWRVDSSSGWCWRGKRGECVLLARAAPPAVTSFHFPHYHPFCGSMQPKR